MRATDWLKLAISLLAPQLAGAIGALYTAETRETWYRELTLPGFSPPDWVFGPVWTTLYILMGIAAFLIWRRGLRQVWPAMLLFVIQLALNALWPFLFFGLRSPLAGLSGIIALWGVLLATVIAFWSVSRAAGALLIPYLAWVSYALILNYSIWRLN